MRLSFALVLACALAAPALAALPADPEHEKGWEEANKESEFTVFTREAKDGLREVLLVGDIAAPPSKAFAAVADLEHYKDFMPYTDESKIVGEKDGAKVFYSLLNPPLVSKRDYLILVTARPGRDDTDVWRTAWHVDASNADGKVPLKDGVVRVSLNDGSWTFTPLDGGKRTHVVYYLYTNPGGSIPMWIANKSNTKALPDLFAAVKKRAGAK